MLKPFFWRSPSMTCIPGWSDAVPAGRWREGGDGWSEEEDMGSPKAMHRLPALSGSRREGNDLSVDRVLGAPEGDERHLAGDAVFGLGVLCEGHDGPRRKPSSPARRRPPAVLGHGEPMPPETHKSEPTPEAMG